MNTSVVRTGSVSIMEMSKLGLPIATCFTKKRATFFEPRLNEILNKPNIKMIFKENAGNIIAHNSLAIQNLKKIFGNKIKYGNFKYIPFGKYYL